MVAHKGNQSTKMAMFEQLCEDFAEYVVRHAGDRRRIDDVAKAVAEHAVEGANRAADERVRALPGSLRMTHDIPKCPRCKQMCKEGARFYALLGDGGHAVCDHCIDPSDDAVQMLSRFYSNNKRMTKYCGPPSPPVPYYEDPYYYSPTSPRHFPSSPAYVEPATNSSYCPPAINDDEDIVRKLTESLTAMKETNIVGAAEGDRGAMWTLAESVAWYAFKKASAETRARSFDEIYGYETKLECYLPECTQCYMCLSTATPCHASTINGDILCNECLGSKNTDARAAFLQIRFNA